MAPKERQGGSIEVYNASEETDLTQIAFGPQGLLFHLCQLNLLLQVTTAHLCKTGRENFSVCLETQVNC